MIALSPALLTPNHAHAQAGPAAYWRLNSANGGVLVDDSGNGRDATLNAGVLAPGIDQLALSLSGTASNYASAGKIFNFNGESFSVSARIRTGDSSSANTIILGRHLTGTLNGWLLRLNRDVANHGQPGKAGFYDSCGASAQLVSTTTITDMQWHHLVVTYSPGGQSKLYVDGNLEASRGASGIVANSVDFLLGGAAVNGTNTGFYNGLLDDVQIYQYEINANQVKYLSRGAGRVLPYACASADITDGSGLLKPDTQLTAADVVLFFNSFFAGCTSPGTPCAKADITDASGSGGPDGQLTASDVVLFFSAFFGGCSIP